LKNAGDELVSSYGPRPQAVDCKWFGFDISSLLAIRSQIPHKQLSGSVFRTTLVMVILALLNANYFNFDHLAGETMVMGVHKEYRCMAVAAVELCV